MPGPTTKVPPPPPPPPVPLPPPSREFEKDVEPFGTIPLHEVTSVAMVGSPARVATELRAFVADTGADELMLTSQIFDHAARLRSYEITADAMGLAAAETA